MFRRTLFAVFALGFAGNVFAGAKEDLHAAFTKFLAQTAFRGANTSTMNGKTTHATVEFQAPDRYRIASAGRPANVIIGDTMYIDMHGRNIKVAIPGETMITKYRDPRVLGQIESSMHAEDLGMDTVGGVAAHKYRYTITDPQPGTCMVWVSKASSLPIQIQTTGKAMGATVDTTIAYSSFSDPSIQISAPN